MLDSDDLSQMRADLTDVRGDHEVSISIRRGTTTLPAQAVRITRSGSGRRAQGEAQEETQAQALVFGPPTLNIQPQDRFTTGGVLYEVVHVRPNRSASTVAEAMIRS